jgi:UDP-N-acetylglucosamine--N-acetylmuramyl-(pentapeptide) pyrophosphoryl-undecaprenol N-acetylglucosamine transferase
LRILLACGGTGGHIYPAIAIAEALVKRHKAEVFFAGSDYGMEKGIIEGKKYRFFPVTARPFIRKFTFRNVINAFYVVKSLFDSAGLIRKICPDIVIGTGGFVSFPVVFAAAMAGVKTLIHEPNTYPGIANRLLGNVASKVTAGFSETARFFPANKTEVTGNPVRDTVIKSSRKKAQKEFGLKASGKTLLVMPGSRAAIRINSVMLETLPLLAEKVQNLQVLWMTGQADLDRVKKGAKGGAARVKALPFIKDSGLAYAAADAAVLRAGASTLSEIAAAGAAAILVPYPHATGNHQEKNAEAFRKSGAAVVIRESNLTKEALLEAIMQIMEKRANGKMRKAAGKIYRGNSAEKIAALAAKEAKA